MAWNPYENQSEGRGGGGGGGGAGGFETPQINLPPNLIAYIFYGLLGLIAIYGIKDAFYTVAPDEQAVVLRFGELHEVSDPGFHLKLPYGIDKVQLFPTLRVLKEEFGFRTLKAGARTEYSRQRFNDESLMLTGDLNIADVGWIVQFKYADPKGLYFHLDEPVQTVRDVAESVLRQVVGNRTVDAVLTTGRAQVEDRARQLMQKVLDTYDSGIKITTLQLQNVTPPEPVQASFNDVNRSEQDMEKMENEALAQLNREIPNAGGEAKRTIDRAVGYKADRINRAQGNVARFLGILQEYRKAPEVTRRRLHLETMRAVLPHVDELTIIDSESATGLLPHFNVRGGGGK